MTDKEALIDMANHPVVWVAILVFIMMGYLRWNIRSYSPQGRLIAALVACAVLAPLYFWRDLPSLDFRNEGTGSLPVIQGENYAMNAPYVFPVRVTAEPRRIDVFSIENCSPANRKIKAVLNHVPSSYRVFYHNITDPKDGTFLANTLMPTGHASAFVGPVFITGGKAFFYNPQLIEQMKPVLVP